MHPVFSVVGRRQARRPATQAVSWAPRSALLARWLRTHEGPRVVVVTVSSVNHHDVR